MRALSRPVNISPNILKSLINDHHGWPKVAGLLPSIKKCPIQANAYDTTGQSNAYHG